MIRAENINWNGMFSIARV